METIYLDTHIVVWLREKELGKLSLKSIKLIEEADRLLISPMVVLELKYLYEIKKITEEPNSIIADLEKMIDLKVDKIDFYDVVKFTQSISWTRDAFDRIIVANAIAKNFKLITKDQKILDNFQGATF